jgi:hypothetical protein
MCQTSRTAMTYARWPEFWFLASVDFFVNPTLAGTILARTVLAKLACFVSELFQLMCVCVFSVMFWWTYKDSPQ